MSQRELQIRPADTPSEELSKILERDGFAEPGTTEPPAVRLLT